MLIIDPGRTEMMKESPAAAIPYKKTIVLAICVALCYGISGYFSRIISSYVTAPKLLRHDNNVLSAALDRVAMNNPDKPGKDENKSIKASGISWFTLSIRPDASG